MATSRLSRGGVSGKPADWLNFARFLDNLLWISDILSEWTTSTTN
jgi:hypothetical protein